MFNNDLISIFVMKGGSGSGGKGKIIRINEGVDFAGWPIETPNMPNYLRRKIEKLLRKSGTPNGALASWQRNPVRKTWQPYLDKVKRRVESAFADNSLGNQIFDHLSKLPAGEEYEVKGGAIELTTKCKYAPANYAAILTALKGIFTNMSGKEFLDIGFGGTAHLEWLANQGAIVHGIEQRKMNVNVPGLNLVTGVDITNFGRHFKGKRFDAIFFRLLADFTWNTGFANMLMSVLKPGGVIISHESLQGWSGDCALIAARNMEKAGFTKILIKRMDLNDTPTLFGVWVYTGIQRTAVPEQ